MTIDWLAIFVGGLSGALVASITVSAAFAFRLRRIQTIPPVAAPARLDDAILACIRGQLSILSDRSVDHEKRMVAVENTLISLTERIPNDA